MEHKYICYNRFKGKGITGDFNIKYGTEVSTDDKFIYSDGDCRTGKTLCTIRSEVGCNHFALNDDGLGMERGSLTSAIVKILACNDEKHQDRWNKIWADSLANTLRRKDYENMWLWDTSFYQASIEDLTHILDLIKEV